jgi:DHA2 family multidrug resistance protein-like MFS transporter
MPYLLSELYQLPASRIGLMMLVTTLGLTICSPLGGYFASRLSNRRVTLAGSLLAAAGMFGLANAETWLNTLAISPWLFLVGAGLGLNTGPVQATVLSAVAGKDAGMASGALSVFRYLGSILGVALLGWLLAQSEMIAIARYRFGFQLYGCTYLICFLLATGIKLPVHTEQR